MNSSDVLFVGKGKGAVSWYRTGQPAFCLGCDWVTFDEQGHVVSGWRRAGLYSPLNLSDYKIVVFQQPYHRQHLHRIRDAQQKGTRVYYEIDDYIHAVRKMPQHAASKIYDKKRLAEHETIMRLCDGLIVSTDFLAERYRRFNENIFVCRNGIDTGRYGQFEIPARNTINIGWAGGEGHQESARLWLPAIRQILASHEDVRFVSIGLPVAEELSDRRAIALPGVSIENFPGALCNFDIAIAPAGRNDFFRAKSDLRWLETAALGIPLVADPFVYGDIEDGKTGLLAETPAEAADHLEQLVGDLAMRAEIGERARQKVVDERDMFAMSEQWVEIFMATVC